MALTAADVLRAYGQVDPGKTGDVQRILAGIGSPATFTFDQISNIPSPPKGTGGIHESGLTGLSSRSMNDWNRVLQMLQPQSSSHEGATGMEASGGMGGHTGGTGGVSSMASNLVNPPAGPQQNLLNNLFSGSVTGQGGGPIANQLFSLGQGVLPKPMQDMITATTNEQFGKLGARFGTDLATSISRGLGQAGSQQSLSAIQQILGLGGTTSGFEFQGTQNSLERALKEFLANQENDLTMQLLPLLLGAGVA